LTLLQRVSNFLHVARNAGRNRTKEPGGDGEAEKLLSVSSAGRIEFGPVVDTDEAI
jgi:hypothetical protein